jgi:uncharacterized alkaline shock family protein YloU
MTASVAESVERPADAGAPDAPPPSGLHTDKGYTSIAPVVVEKIAGRAATEVDGVANVAPAGLRRFFSSTTASTDGMADADARVGAERTAVAVTVSVRYPLPVRSTSEQVRSAVAHRVHQLTGLQVSSVDVTVAQMPATDPVKRTRVQ